MLKEFGQGLRPTLIIAVLVGAMVLDVSFVTIAGDGRTLHLSQIWVYGLAGVAISLVRRAYNKTTRTSTETKDSSASIIINDGSLAKITSTKVITFAYSVTHGLLLGTTFGLGVRTFFKIALAKPQEPQALHLSPDLSIHVYIAAALAALYALIVSRVVFEEIIVNRMAVNNTNSKSN